MQTCQTALDKIVPCLNEAVNTMHEISKYDIAEIRSMNNPPKMIKKVLKCVCILLDVEKLPKKKSDGSFKESYWQAALGP